MEHKFDLCQETISNEDIGFKSPEETFGLISEMGFYGVETTHKAFKKPVWEMTQKERGAIAKAAENAGLEIIGGHWMLSQDTYKGKPLHLMGFDLGTGKYDPVILNNTIDFGKKMLQFIGDVGGKIEVLGSPKQRSLPPSADFQSATTYMQHYLGQMQEIQKKYGIVICLEPLAPAETNYINDDEGANKVLDALGSDSLYGLLLDVKAMSAVGDPVEIIGQTKKPKRLKHFHVQDATKIAIGQGDTDFTPILKALKKIGYTDHVSAEHFVYQPDPLKLAAEACNYMRECNSVVNLWG